MPKSVPSYRQRSGSDQAIVTLTDAQTKQRRDYWLGPFDTPASRERYHRLIAQWEAQGRVLPPTDADPVAGPHKVTIDEIINAYRKWSDGYYTASEANTIRRRCACCGTSTARRRVPQGPGSLQLRR